MESFQANQILRPSKGGKGRTGCQSEAFMLCRRADPLNADVKSSLNQGGMMLRIRKDTDVETLRHMIQRVRDSADGKMAQDKCFLNPLFLFYSL